MPRRTFHAPRPAEPYVTRQSQGSPITAAIKAAGQHGDGLYPYPDQPLPGGPEGYVRFIFTAPSTPTGVNTTHGKHWRASGVDKILWQRAGLAAALAAADILAPYRGHRIQMTFLLPLVGWKVADSGNYVSGVSVKGAQDGIARSLTVIPDDKWKWLQTDCLFWSGGPTKDEVRVRVQVASQPWDGS